MENNGIKILLSGRGEGPVHLDPNKYRFIRKRKHTHGSNGSVVRQPNKRYDNVAR